MLAALTAACASRESQRPKPTEIIRSCSTLVEKVRFRDQFFKALRGRAIATGLGVTTELQLAIAAPSEARLEFTGPLGVRLGLLQINEQWVLLYIPKENTVLRFPTAELYKDTARRERFLRLLPLPIVPDAFFDSLLTRVNLPKGLDSQSLRCGFDEEKNLYWLRVQNTGRAQNSSGGRWVWVDPFSFAPVKVDYFEGHLPEKWPGGRGRAIIEVRFGDFQGEAAATLPREIKIVANGQKRLEFQWEQAEIWKSYNSNVFQWRPAASMKVKDY